MSSFKKLKKFKPHEYQKDGIKWVVSNQHAGLFLKPGLGKTAIILSAWKILKDNGFVDKLLVIAPLRVCYMVWPREVTKWENFNHFSVGVLHGKDKDKVIDEEHDIYVINPEGIKWLTSKLAKNHLIKNDENWFLVVDESSMFKNHTSQRFKKLKSILRKFTRRAILTGTPAPNGLINLWSQLYLLDMGQRLGKYVTQFKNDYFYPVGFNGYQQVLQQDGQDRLYKQIDDIIMHKGDEELDLPPRLNNFIKIDLPTNARKIYDDMRHEMIAMLEDGSESIAVNSAVKSGKLRQICNGGIYTEEGDMVHVHHRKTESVQELVESLSGNPIMVFYEFRHDLDRLLKAFPDTPYLGGGVSAARTEEIADLWNNNQLPVLFLHPMAAGHGLNLQESTCHDICWYSIPWDLELYEQAVARVHRQGVKNSVIVHHLVMEQTIDERVLRVLNGKSTIQSALLEEMRK